MSGSSAAIGIDLGTANSCVGVWKNGKIEILINDHGNRATPSYVAFTSTERLIGDSAKNQMIMNPKYTVFGSKRLIGRFYNDPVVQSDIKLWTFDVVEDCGKIKIPMELKGEKIFLTPEEVSAMVLGKMKQIAENYLKQDVRDAVIGVPAYFTHSQRQATKDAATIAGFNVLRIINESTAAAITYGLQKKFTGIHNIMILDLGAGNFHVSVVVVINGMEFEVKSTAGDTNLGGKDFDDCYLVHLIKEFNRKFNKDIKSNPVALNKLRTAAELAKITLSSSTKIILEVDNVFEGINFSINLTRASFENMCANMFSATLCLVEKALIDAKLDKSSIHDVIMVGGSSQMPKIKNLLKHFFGRDLLNFSINPHEAVAYGAGIQAAILSGTKHPILDGVKLMDVTPLSLGIETAGGIMTKMIERNSRLPCKGSQLFSTYCDNQSAVTIQVFEGERPMTKDNNILGTFHLTGISPAPRGIPEVEVNFEVNADGIMNVTARESNTGNVNNVTISNENKQRLTLQEIDKMLKDTETYKIEDELQRERIKVRNELEGFIFSMKQAIDEDGNKLSERDKNIVKQKCNNCLKRLDKNFFIDKEDIEYILRDLQLDCCQIIARYLTTQQ